MCIRDSFLDTKTRFYFDVNPAKAVFSTPKLYGNTLFTNQDSVDFEGSMSQDSFGYSLLINGNIVSEFFSTDGGGEKVNESSFNRKFDVKDKDIIHVEVNNTTASSLQTFIPVVVDKLNPKVNIGVESNETIKDNRSIKVKVKDDNLKLVKVYVDGNVVASSENQLVSRSIEDTLTDADSDNNSESNVSADKPDKTEFDFDIPTSDLTNGKHTIKVEAVDYAGNITTDTGNSSDTISKVIVVDHLEPPSSSVEAPKAPESVSSLDKSVKGNLVVGANKNNIARAGIENPMTLTFEGLLDAAGSGDSDGSGSGSSAPAEGSTPKAPGVAKGENDVSATSEFVNTLKTYKVAYAYAYIYSSPELLKGEGGTNYVKVTLDGNKVKFNAKIPENYSGIHTIVLLNSEGQQIAWTNVYVIPSNADQFVEANAEEYLKYYERPVSYDSSDDSSVKSEDSKNNVKNDSKESEESKSSNGVHRHDSVKKSKSKVAHTGVDVMPVMMMSVMLIVCVVFYVSVREVKELVSRVNVLS